MKPLVLISEQLADKPCEWLAEHADLRRLPFDHKAFDDTLGEAHALVVRTYTNVDRSLLDKAPKLRVVGRAGVALDNIDLDACRARGVEVVHTPGANASAVAEYVFALILDATRPRAEMTRPLPLDEFSRVRAELVASRQLQHATIGILGLGRIGSRVARIANAFEMHAVYHDLETKPESDRHGATPVAREQLLEQSDIVTVHIDDRPANRHSLSTDAFGRMRPDVVFLNCARGLVVDPFALADFMTSHPAARALLDVHDPEPFDETYPLLDIQNVHLFPHIAAATEQAKENMSWVVRDVWRVLQGQRPISPAPA
jgi:phosphoglycerate dehydrogenase-like enzyme